MYYVNQLRGNMTTQQTVVRVDKMNAYFNYIKKSKALKLFFNSLDDDEDIKNIEAHFKLISKQPTKTSGWYDQEMRKKVDKRYKNGKLIQDKDGNWHMSEDY